MKNKIIITLMLLSSYVSFSQKNITWEDLAKVEFIEKFFPSYGEHFLYPKFSDSVKSLEGKRVTITGYFLNIDPQGKLLILSKGPMSSCFFCGIGGPETAMELQFTSKKTFKTDAIITVTGILELNADDVEHFNYILKECEALLVK
ncbi:hypothetical protein Q4Q35_06490 [Flavivirga aquimarina]|uniref:DUF3299 domain-containing protein n=1 Tax=Flavivirga aquimarina TaxID=2027862 RepID=A0ABT8W8L5_9FLAO|nr:hypothetical protein [Flavivirga aquimarina]MDO5969450.1 hypothetical protein [Flavivirga aquimarina]